MLRSFFSIFFIVFVSVNYAQSIDSLNAIKPDTLKKKLDSKLKFQKITLDPNTIRIYERPRVLDMVTKIPRDLLATTKDFVAKDHAWYLGGAVASTVALLPVDQQLIDNSRSFGDQLGMSPDNSYGTFGPLQNIPKNVGAGLYLVGNGTTVILLSAGFVTYGLLANNYRAQATASGLMESMAVSGAYVQLIKRITGRESPYIARQNGNPGGDWNPFPSFAAYAKNTPHYDAVPSGHLTTIMSGLTVITTNYPEYKWIKPVGYTLIAGMCFQMMQSEVHWASDYPIALLVGYFSGKNIARNRFKEIKTNGTSFREKQYDLRVTGSQIGDYKMLGLNLTF